MKLFPLKNNQINNCIEIYKYNIINIIIILYYESMGNSQIY